MEASPGHRQLDPSGLIGDLKTENIMLSKVDAQMLLHSKCKLLATELAQFLAKDSRLVLVDPLVDVVKQCLGELPDASLLPTTVLDNFTKSRIELCLLLFQKLIVIQDGAKLQDVAALFADVWDVCRSLIPEFDSVYTSDKVDMNRQLLRILFLSLQPLTAQAPRTPRQKGTQQHALRNVPPEISALLLQVLADVVTRGFKSVAAILHENLTACEPSDFALIIAILQTILKIPGADLLYAQIALEFANSSLHQYAARLFSWSDQLLVDGDPIYGEHSILFLLELSSIPKMAETLATGGILSQLSSANLMGGLLRPNGVGPFDNPVRLHSIWARGVLPLCLNLLDAVGPPLAGEVVSFLNQYPNQLQRLVRSLANRRAPTGTRPGDSHMTLNMAAETHSLALIWLVVERYRAAGSATGAFVSEIPALDWDKASVNEDVDDWLQGRAALRSRIVPANDRESELSRLRPADPTSRTDNRLEEKIWEELSGALECFSAVVEG
jgi:nuclear pore complex protein Nup188